MPRLFTTVVLAALLGLVGCVTPSADSRLVGTYIGKDSEALIIFPDTRVYHTRLANGQEQRIMIGYAAAASSSPPGSLSIIAPDTSPFIGTRLQVSADFRTITVSWQNYGDPKHTPSQTEFVRRGDGCTSYCENHEPRPDPISTMADSELIDSLEGATSGSTSRSLFCE